MRVSRAAVLLAAFVAACGQGAKKDSGASTGKGTNGVKYVVSVSRPVGGTIRSSDGSIDCGTLNGSANKCDAATYDWTTKVTLTAIADPGFSFVSWAGDCGDPDLACTFDMVANPGADKWVVAVFNRNGQIGHGNYTSPAKHGPAFFRFLAGDGDAPKCNTCHGAAYQGVSIAPNCNTCHEAAGWTNWQANCTFCHGTRTPAGGTQALSAPPDDLTGRLTGTQGVAVGAHQIHLVGSSLADPIDCTECHAVPASGDTSHATGVGSGGARATLTFGTLAKKGSPTASYAGSTSASGGSTAGTCSNVYCHGATMAGGGMKSPNWMQLDGTAIACAACHGAPPPSPHPAGTDCGACHPGYTGSSVNTTLHVNGSVERDLTAASCGICHGLPPTTVGILVPGPHTGQPHSTSTDCGACHPGYSNSTIVDGTHANGQVEFALTSASCNLCHASPPTLTGVLVPRADHATPAHPPIADCALCHGTGYSAVAGMVAATHINGAVEIAATTCTTCHGDATRVGVTGSDVNQASAPPRSFAGLQNITDLPVGAHVAHLAGITQAGVRLSAPVACAACHIVPGTGDLSHVGGGRGAVVPAVAYDTTAHSCSTSCHGSTLSGGVNKLPAWTTTLSGASCGACHGFPPSTRGHVGVASNDATLCARCHHGTVASDGSIIVSGGSSLHVNGVVDEDVSGGAQDCSKCHASLAMGANSATYHHVMGALADGWSVYPSNPAPTFATDKNCVQCHVDHDLFTAARGANLRASIAGITPSSDDAGACVSCHGSTQVKDRSNQKDDGTLGTYAIDSAAYGAGGHSYLVGGSIGGTGLDFTVSCTKCHNSTADTLFQDGGFKFGLHESADRRLRGPLGRATVADDVAEDFCYRCHSNAADPVGGIKKGTDLSDWYGATSMPPGSTGIYTQMIGTPALTSTTANTDTLFFKPVAQESASGGPASGTAETGTAATNVLYLTSQAATGAPSGYLDAGVTFDTSVLRQNAMSLTADTTQTTAYGSVTTGVTGYDKVAQFLSPPLAKAATWSSGAQFALNLNRQELATTNNCNFRYAVYKWSAGVATQIVTTTNAASEFPITAGTSSFNMSTSSSQSFVAGDQILVEIGIYKNAPTASAANACIVKWGLTATDSTRLVLPATTDSTFPEFQTGTPLALNTTWVARSMSPYAPTVANETITGSGNANAFQSMLWKRASFTSPPAGVATTLPSANWTLNVYDARGSMSSSTVFLRYRIFRWNADGTQGPDIVAWRTHTSGMGSSLALQTITVPAAAVATTPIAVGDRVVVEIEAESMNLTTSATNNSTVVFGLSSQSSVILPAKVTFAYSYTTPAAPATVGHLGGLYTGVHRPNPAEETLARIASAKHVECSDCHDPHQAKRGNQADGGTATTASASTLTDANQSWATSAWVGFYVDIVSGTGVGGRAQITANDATTLIFGPLGTAPASGSAYRISMKGVGGAVVTATASTLTDSQSAIGGSKAWQTNVFAGWSVNIVLGLGAGTSATILSNSTNQLTISGTWAIQPDATSRYVVTRLPNVLTGATGVNVTAWGTTSKAAWGTNTFFPTPNSSTTIPDANVEWQVCFKCHSSANVNVTAWKSGFSDNAEAFNPRNQSYHPVIAPAAAASGTGIGNTQLTAAQLTNGWKPGDVMYCSDCHGNTDTGYGASQGPHASAVKYLLRGANTRWPFQADGTTRWTTSNTGTGTGTKDGLFCLNCHPWPGNSVHSSGNHSGAACTTCHIQIPHGGKVKRLIRTTNTPFPYADMGVTAGFNAYNGGTSSSGCGTPGSCTTSHSAAVTATNSW